MENPRPEKVAVVAEVREKLEGADAVLLTEYRGISVGSMQALRAALREAGGDYKIYKNTLVRFAARDLGLELDELLTGPTALAFVAPGPDGAAGDPVLVAKALKEFAKVEPNLVVKGGLLGERLLSADDTKALAEVAPREELLARLAGGMAAPMQQFAALLKAVPTSFAYGLRALIDQGGAPGAPTADEAPAPAADTETEAPSGAETQTAEAPAAANETEADAGDAAPAEAESTTEES